MTPLARRIVKTLTNKRSDLIDECGLLRMMSDIHCFECTDVIPIATMLKAQVREKGSDARTTFLPAPKTWIEAAQTPSDLGLDMPGRGLIRFGALLVEIPETKQAQVFCATDIGGRIRCSSWDDEFLDLEFEPYTREELSSYKYLRKRYCDTIGFDEAKGTLWNANFIFHEECLIALLALINSPHIVDRTTHVAPKTLERKILAQHRGESYRFLDWSEIKLNIGTDNLSGSSSARRLTGQKALHFCRSYVRIKRGKLEIVRSHWRGNAANGIGRADYTVTF